MPRYKVNEKTYNLPEDKVEGFLQQFPDAIAIEDEAQDFPTSTVEDADAVQQPMTASQAGYVDPKDTESSSVVGLSDFFHLKDTWNSEFKKCLLFVEYNDLIKATQKTLNKIYDFIEQPYYKHDLNNIVSNDPLKEVEKIYGLKGLHNLQKTIKKSITSTDILDAKELKYYSLQNFWRIND